MRQEWKKIFPILLSVTMLGGTVPVTAAASQTASTESAAVIEEEAGNTTGSMAEEIEGNLRRKTKSGKYKEDASTHVNINTKSGEEVFMASDYVWLEETDEETLKDVSGDILKAVPAGYDVEAAYDISVISPDGEEIEPGEDINISLYLPEDMVQKVKGTDLYHVTDNGAQKTEYSIWKEKTNSEEDEQYVYYITFTASSLSPFLFIKGKEDVADDNSSDTEEKEETEEEKPEEEKTSSETASKAETTAETASAEIAAEKEPEKKSTESGSADTSAASSQKAAETVKTGESTQEASVKESAGAKKETGLINRIASLFKPSVKSADSEERTAVTIDSLSLSLFSGAKKQSDGTYMWTPSKTDSGHAFGYRISFSTSGEGTLPAGAVILTIPADVFKDRNGNTADSETWSIPSEAEIENARNADGTLNMDLIDSDSYYAYRKKGDSYEIYNFREVPSAQNNYIELTYTLDKTTFSYTDMENHDMSCSISVKNGEDTLTKKAGPVTAVINTDAKIDYTSVSYPGSRIKTWNSAWGNSVKPSDTSKYYYLVFDITSSITATQPYDFVLSDDVLTSNLGDKMEILGYRMSGGSGWKKEKETVHNLTMNGKRYDQVLVGIPLDTYLSEAEWNSDEGKEILSEHGGLRYWRADYKVTGNVTPADKADPLTQASGSNWWSWTQPVFHEPTGWFNGAKYGDGAYRSKWGYPGHYASSRNLKTGEWTRYDLEEFNGYDENNADHYDAANIKSTSFGNFDFGSWMYAYPGRWTADGDTKTAENYFKNNVKYVLTDEGVYLLNSDAALGSSDASSERTIDNGSILATSGGSTSAIKLTSDDFYINKLEYSWYMRDASLDDETMTFAQKGVTYTDSDILTFEGKFNGSDTWTTFGTYNIKTGTATPVNTYVSSMDSGTVTFKGGQNLTAYRVSTENAHYFTEIFTVPFYTLKNSSAVLSLLKGHRTMILLNNNKAEVYLKSEDGTDYEDSAAITTYHSDCDYATVSVKNSGLAKKVVSYGNSARSRKYTITWRLDESETVTAGESGTTSYLPQDGGVFYDLLPDGAMFNESSVSVNGGDITDFTVNTIKNYKKTGRTLLVIKINTEADHFYVTFDTVHSWNSINDFGRNVYNPAAYETGNESITKGFPDNGGTKTAAGTVVEEPTVGTLYASAMSDLSKGAGMSDESITDPRFLYTSYTWDITSLMSASAGLTKKVKADRDVQYGANAKTTIGDSYSYELRFMTAPGSGNRAKNIILYDSLENFGTDSKRDDGSSSSWHGILTGIDTSQMVKKGADVKVYISEKENLDPETDNDLTKADIWTKVTDSTDLSKAKAVAVDLTKKEDGTDFSLDAGESVVAYLYMQAPDTAPDSKDGESYPYAYNNVYASDTVYSAEEENSADFMIHQDYTKVSLTVSGNLKAKKTNEKTGEEIPGITFRIYGTSDYGTAVDSSIVTDADGYMSLTGFEKGEYILQEQDSTDDWLPDTTEHSVKIDGKGHCIIDGTDINGENAGDFIITNLPRVHTDITFKKADVLYNSKKLPAAQYRLSGRSAYGTDVLATAQSGDDGTVTFNNIEKGTYTLKEIEAPDGYVLDETEYTVTIDEDGNFTITMPSVSSSSKSQDFDYTGDVQTYEAAPGTYKLEVWGAEGGSSAYHNVSGGKGGYSAGTVTFDSPTTLYIYVGGKGNTGSYDVMGGWNGGGGISNSYSSGGTGNHLGSGGGATDITTVESAVTTDSYNRYERTAESYNGRIIVAGGGGGAESAAGTAGGGLAGVSDSNGSYGGTQSAAGSFVYGGSNTATYVTMFAGGLGYGVSTTGGHTNHAMGGAGGGGYYGGGAYGYNGQGSHGYGGSGYVGSLEDASTAAGNTAFTSPSGEEETGHSGNGYARITAIFTDTQYVDADREGNTYILKDEPLHYFTFTKKSGYDQSVLGGAEFSLTGTSDRGTAVSLTSVSEDETGTVRFDGLEAGTYLFTEVSAPEGFYAEGETENEPDARTSHAVRINTDGTFTISGLTRDKAGGYILYDIKKADRQVTVTKIWDDGESTHSPDDLSVTITTDVPEASTRNYTVIYDANGGKF